MRTLALSLAIVAFAAAQDCPATCQEYNCESYINGPGGYTCSVLEDEYSCDCGGCNCVPQCPQTCGGATCDDYIAGTLAFEGATCSYMEGLGCDCNGCGCTCDTTCGVFGLMETCDFWVYYYGVTCDLLENTYGCECGACSTCYGYPTEYVWTEEFPADSGITVEIPYTYDPNPYECSSQVFDTIAWSTFRLPEWSGRGGTCEWTQDDISVVLPTFMGLYGWSSGEGGYPPECDAAYCDGQYNAACCADPGFGNGGAISEATTNYEGGLTKNEWDGTCPIMHWGCTYGVDEGCTWEQAVEGEVINPAGGQCTPGGKAISGFSAIFAKFCPVTCSNTEATNENGYSYGDLCTDDEICGAGGTAGHDADFFLHGFLDRLFAPALEPYGGAFAFTCDAVANPTLYSVWDLFGYCEAFIRVLCPGTSSPNICEMGEWFWELIGIPLYDPYMCKCDLFQNGIDETEGTVACGKIQWTDTLVCYPEQADGCGSADTMCYVAAEDYDGDGWQPPCKDKKGSKYCKKLTKKGKCTNKKGKTAKKAKKCQASCDTCVTLD